MAKPDIGFVLSTIIVVYVNWII